MSGEQRATVWVVALLVLAGILFGGNPDLIDAIVYNLMQ